MQGSSTADKQTVNPANGQWEYNYGSELADGTYTIKVTSTDAAGNTFETEQTLVIDNQVINEFNWIQTPVKVIPII